MKTRVDFCHLLHEDQLDSFLCRSALRLIDQGSQVLMRLENDARVQEISRQMWIFPPAFISHEIVDPDTPPDSLNHQLAQLLLSAVQVNWACPVLVNGSHEFPHNFANYNHIVEIIVPEKASVEAGRKRYELYRARDCELQYHKIDKSP